MGSEPRYTRQPLRDLAAALVLAPLIMLLGACQNDDAEQRFSTYLSRLERTMDEEQPPFTPTSLPAFPAPARLHLELASSSLDTLDFLALSGCEVQITIGKRNSSLGRMAAPSQRLLLDLEYLRLAPSCIELLTDKGKTDLAETLQQAYSLKQAQLPQRIYLATLVSPEFRAFWRPPVLLEDYPRHTSSAVITALEYIVRQTEHWLAGDYQADGGQFELALNEVSKGDGGALLMALALQADQLTAADQLIAQRQARGPLCHGPIRPEAADILPNVVQKFFISDIQGWSASVASRRFGLLPPIDQLEQQLSSALPPAYRAWQQHRYAALDRGTEAPRLHVDAVKALLAPCGGIAPQPP